MSILVTGVEMPKNEPLLVKINPDGSASTTAKNNYKKYEAIPIPPHGRLIDADALIRDNGIREIPEYHEVVLAAPTIIPTEEDET